MNQSTAKNLRDLLIKQQLNRKIKFKNEPLNLAKQKIIRQLEQKSRDNLVLLQSKELQYLHKKASCNQCFSFMKIQDNKSEMKISSSVSANQSANLEKQYQMQQIHKGEFGRVWRVEMKKNKKLYALKEMSKAKVIQKRSVNSVLNERYLLEYLHHPFFINMWYAFQDRDNLFLIIDLLTGGIIRFHLGKMRRFSEAQTKFFVACILLALTYLHQNGIIHGDLKPENLVLDEDGYMRLTNLRLAKMNKQNNAGNTSGTPGYMAPELWLIIMHQEQQLMNQCWQNTLQWKNYTRYQRINSSSVSLSKKRGIPLGWSENSLDFVNQLIQRQPVRRLGTNGIEEILHHSWLKGYPWEILAKKKIQAPYVPGAIDDNYDFQNLISEETQLDNEQSLEIQELLRRDTLYLRNIILMLNQKLFNINKHKRINLKEYHNLFLHNKKCGIKKLLIIYINYK